MPKQGYTNSRLRAARAAHNRGRYRGLLPYVDLTAALEPRPWLIVDRIPRRNVTLLSGEGSIGKSILLMQLLGATVRGELWLGSVPERGPVLYLSAEEEDNEVRHRMQAVAASLRTTREQLVKDGLRVLSFAGKDAVLAEPDRDGILRSTPLFARILEDAVALKPKVIALDAAADVFGGNEINRAQARQFITLLRYLAMATDAAVILVAHPSLQGIASDSGLSGSTAWHNSVRARMYLKKAPGEDEALRALEVKKNNYGPVTRPSCCAGKTASTSPSPDKAPLNSSHAKRRQTSSSLRSCGGSPHKVATLAISRARLLRRPNLLPSPKPRRQRSAARLWPMPCGGCSPPGKSALCPKARRRGYGLGLLRP